MTDAARLTAALADRYSIERELGQGGMATVYLAQDIKHDRKVAVKVLRPELAAVIGADRFLAEIKTTANLQHPHILPLFDSGVVTLGHPERSEGPQSLLFYVMPFIEGESLRDRLTREKQLSIPDAVRIASEVASALDYAHRHGVIHRDIKPENILLHDGSALVADFGIALAASKAGSRMTETGMSLGTPHYMSPEQAMGEREITARSDVYALGCITYEMLVGQPPFTGATAQAIVAKVVTEKPAALIPQRDTVPEPVEDAVLRALAKLPADRFASAADFAAALAAPAATGLRRPHQAATGGRWRIAALMAITAIVAAGGGALLRGGSHTSSGQTVRFSIPVTIGDVDFGPGLDVSRDGSQVVYIGRAANGRTAIVRRVLSERESRVVTGTNDALVRSPVFSPDGEMIAFTSESKLRVLSVHGGNERTLVEGISPTSGGISWGPGDNIVFERIFGAGLSIVNTKDGKSRELTHVDSTKGIDHRWPQVLPDGKSVIFTIWNGVGSASRVAIASLATGEVRELFAGSYARYSDAGQLVYVDPNQTLARVAFDAATGRINGNPVPVDDSVAVPGDGSAQYAIAGNGTLVSFRSLGRRTPVLVDRSGAASEVPHIPPAIYMSPRFSPNGRTFALEVSSANIWAFDSDHQTFTPATDGGGFYAVWTPDGSRIVYSVDEKGGQVNIYSVPLNHSEGRRAVVTGRGQTRTQDLSHDGKRLLVRQTSSPGVFDLFVVAPDSMAAPVPWLVTPFLERAPTFSPNDRWVAYSSNESGIDEIYVRPFEGSGGRIPVTSGGGIEPVWSHDGTELFYRTIGGSLQVVKVDAGQAFKVLSQPTALFTDHYFWYVWARQYDVMPDGKHFLFLRSETSQLDMNVVLNWVNTIKQAAGSR